LKKRSDVTWENSALSDKIIAKYFEWKLSHWEKNIADRAPVITVSENIAKIYSDFGSDTFVVPNYPSSLELLNITLEKKSTLFTMAYVGNDISKILRAYRDTSGIIDIVKDVNLPFLVIGDTNLTSRGLVNSCGFIPHLKLFSVLSRCHVGIIPWRKHLLHKYLNPNKPYLYAHSGLVVIVPSSLIEVIKAFKNNCLAIENILDLKHVLSDLSHDKVIKEGQKTNDYAKKHFLWELFEKRIINAYSRA
jgi:hypothetical protein